MQQSNAIPRPRRSQGRRECLKRTQRRWQRLQLLAALEHLECSFVGPVRPEHAPLARLLEYIDTEARP